MIREVTLWPNPSETQNNQFTTGERIPLRTWIAYLDRLANQLSEHELASATIVPSPLPIRYSRRVSEQEILAYRNRLVETLLPELKAGKLDPKAIEAFEQEWVTLSRLGE